MSSGSCMSLYRVLMVQEMPPDAVLTGRMYPPLNGLGVPWVVWESLIGVIFDE